MTYRLYKQPAKPHRLRNRWILLGMSLAGFSSGGLGLAASLAEAKPAPMPATPLVISEVQTGGCGGVIPCAEDTRQEFVELYNTSDTALQASGWKLQYVSSSGKTVTDLQTIAGEIAPHSYTLFSHVGYLAGSSDFTFGSETDSGKLAQSGGHVQLADSSGIIVDRLGWGSAGQAWGKPAPAPAAGQSLERQTTNGTASSAANNLHDFAIQDMPTPQGGITADEPEQPVKPALTCEGIVISELLPNPAGADAGQEFIELYNPTDEVISLEGCSLQTSADSTTYAFDTTSLQPGEYRVFRDDATNLTLPNSAGGSAWLLGPADELQAITYPGGLEDGVAWIFQEGAWSLSYSATPGAANVLAATKPCPAGQVRNPDTNRCASASNGEKASGLVPCGPGQERNPDTNRCRAIPAASTMAACPPGQTRNPQTHRCRKDTAGSKTLTPCKQGQERNPATNRCRSIAGNAGPKPCPAGQARNPETNRCRKIAAGGAANGTGNGLGGVEDIASNRPAAGKPYWIIAAVLIAGALAYAAYEWRQEMVEFARARLARLKPAAARP